MANHVEITQAPDIRPAIDAGAPDALFPLRFTPFEYYYLLEDRPGYASVFPINLQCRGPLDRDALEQAFQLAHERHPFLSARIEYDAKQWPTWVAGETPVICWTDSTECDSGESSGVASSGGLLMRVRTAGDQNEFQFVFHHVAVDGMGGFQFIADLFLAYAHYSTGESGPPALRRQDVARLRDRDGHQLFNRKVKLVDLLRIAKVFLPLQLRRPAVICPHEPPQQGQMPADLVGEYVVHHLSEQETAELSRVARNLSVMLNELLMRDYFMMLAKWNQGSAESRRPIRLVVPTNLRRREDYRMPAANVFSLAFLTRRMDQCQQREELLQSIRDEMATIKSHKRGLYFEAALRLSCVWPAMLRWSLSRPWPFATAIFTNLGTGLDNVPLPVCDGRRVCGDLVFEGGSGAGPLRPDTRVSFAVHTYAGRMAICVRCDPRSFSAAEQQAILNAFVEQLRTTIETES